MVEKEITLSIIIPCFNEERTLKKCIERVLNIAEKSLSLELIIVDDCSTDNSIEIARDLEAKNINIRLLKHERNKGKGAALRTGFKAANGDYIAVQDADLEYDPEDLKKLIVPLIDGKADVVFGSRFLSSGIHRVLYFWHYLGNRILTFISNMFTDLNLTDMETCYKVFKKEILKEIDICENRFGFEPEIVAKIAQKRLRIYEMGISYYGRTYEEGKKIGFKDGLRALYCIFHYNAPKAPVPIQIMIYLLIGGFAAVINYIVFLLLMNRGTDVIYAAPAAFILAATVNYLLCIAILFRHKAKWSTSGEMLFYWFVVGVVCIIDLWVTKSFIMLGSNYSQAKIIATLVGLIFNFFGRKYLVFKEDSAGPWKAQEK